jgi:plasmid stabilization system protein ParE
MPRYQIKISPEALSDIQEATDWYNEQLNGLGARFQKQTVKQINKLASSAGLYHIRYNDVRCMVVRKFPFLIHFTLNSEQNIVTVYAVFHTSRNPQIWYKRK